MESESKTKPLPSSHQQTRKSVTSSAAVIAAGILTSRVLGLVRDVMTARYFTADARDAFIAAFRLPNFFRRILGEGSLSVSFIPVFVGILKGENRRSANHDSGSGLDHHSEEHQRALRLVSATASLLATVSILLSCVAIIFMEDIFSFLLRGDAYTSVPLKLAMTVRLGRIMFAFLIVISFYAFFMSILNGLRRFATAAVAPCLLNIAMIAAAWSSVRIGADATILAWAVLVGGTLQMLVLIPEVVRSGFFPRWTFQWNNPDFLHLLGRVLPGVFAMSVMQLTALVNMSFASYLPTGTLSYLYFADRILEFPLSLVVVSVGSALLPTLAGFHASGDRRAMGDTINHYIRLILFISIPAAIGMFSLAQPITEVLFLRGEFKYTDALATADVIRVYSFSVVIASAVRILAQGFYAIQNAWYPALAGAVTLVSHFIFAYVLTRAFKIEGLAAASVASGTVHLLMLAVAYKSWVGEIEWKPLVIGIAKFVACGVLMALVLEAHTPIRTWMAGRIPFARYSSLAFIIVTAALTYGFGAWALRVDEFSETLQVASHKLRSLRARFKQD